MTRILVVDDDEHVRNVLHDALQQDGYEVETVCSGRQALTAIARNRPALLVLDLHMPELDGPGLIDTLRNQTDWGSVPLVVLSSAPDAPAISRRLGARECLAKPFDVARLLAAVEQAAPS
jgi:two-component system, chemotaxis family, chemotaxis protein CheY